MRVSDKSVGVGVAPKLGEGKPAGQAPTAAASGSVRTPGDALSVSGSAQFIAVVKEKLGKLPEVRTEKVEALKAKLDNDDYHPAAEAVADGLMREHTPPHRT